MSKIHPQAGQGFVVLHHWVHVKIHKTLAKHKGWHQDFPDRGQARDQQSLDWSAEMFKAKFWALLEENLKVNHQGDRLSSGTTYFSYT